MTRPASRHSLCHQNGFRGVGKTVGRKPSLSLRQFDKLVHPFDGIVYGYMEHWICFFDCQGRLLGRFKGRVRRLGLPIHFGGGIDPYPVVSPAPTVSGRVLPSRSFYWLWSSLVLALTSHDFSFGFVINDLSAIGAVRRSSRYRVPFCGGRQSSPRAAPAYALGGLLRFFLAPFSRMVFRRTFDASSRGRRLPVASPF
jgi:hypothetical protein